MSARPGNKTMVMIHGAWQGSWSFDAWRPYLTQRGWRTIAIDLPGNGCDPDDRTLPADVSLQLYTDHVVKLLKSLDRPAVLLAHSGGGVVASQAAEAAPECVECLVYLAGMMLPSGMSFGELIERYLEQDPDYGVDGVSPHLYWSADGLSSMVPPHIARDLFVQDINETEALQAVAKLRPQAERGRTMRPALTPQRHGSVPRVYVEALRDNSVKLPFQRLMQTLSPGALRLTLDCGHVPQAAQPQALTALLCPVLEQRSYLHGASG
ncbi:MAG: alpha/beta hydrolase family protein [Herbaspirillum sp.]|jgi:pimeloyl-ACP methyl ester carboxylesterase|nr:alpha/beta hydrolase family protein [Herbaspirillum sp.]